MRLVPLALVFMLTVSGCVGSSKSATSPTASVADTPAADAATGSISGQVLDEESRPIARATAAIMAPPREAETDLEGRFTFNGLEPGEYAIHVQRIGFDQAVRKVSVVAGEVMPVQIVLRQLVLDREWHYVETTARDMRGGSYVAAYPNDLQTWTQKWTLKDDPTALGDLFIEADWNPSTALGDGIRFWSGIATWDSEKSLCRGTGFDPYKCRVAPEKIAQDWQCDFKKEPKSCVGEWMFRPGGSEVTSGQIGLWPQDKLSVHISHFFRQTAPSDYSALT